MSRKMLVVVALCCLLVSTFVAPGVAAAPEADDAVPLLAEISVGPDGHPETGLQPIQPNGDCEGGGSGGCPVPG